MFIFLRKQLEISQFQKNIFNGNVTNSKAGPIQQLGSGMEEIKNVPGSWIKTKQMEELQREENSKKFADDDKHRRLQCNTDP